MALPIRMIVPAPITRPTPTVTPRPIAPPSECFSATARRRSWAGSCHHSTTPKTSSSVLVPKLRIASAPESEIEVASRIPATTTRQMKATTTAPIGERIRQRNPGEPAVRVGLA